MVVYLVTDGVDHCKLGYLPKRYLRFANELNGELVQVVEILEDGNLPDRIKSRKSKGMCRAALVGNVAKMNL